MAKTKIPFSITIVPDTSYTYQYDDSNCWMRHVNSSAINAIVPNHTAVDFRIGTEIVVEQAGAGQVTLVADVEVVINTPATLQTNAQWSVVMLKKVDVDEWTLCGDIAAS